jgi:hypothetical protein
MHQRSWLRVLLLKVVYSCCFWLLGWAFYIFVCTVSDCDGGNRTRNIVVYTWRFSLLSYGRQPEVWQVRVEKSSGQLETRGSGEIHTFSAILAGQPRLDNGSKENAYLDLAPHRTFTLLGHMLCCITESRRACHRKIRHIYIYIYKVASHALFIELNIVGFTLISLFSNVLSIFIQCNNRKIYFLVLRGIYRYKYIYLYIYLLIYVYIFMYVCIFIHTFIYRDLRPPPLSIKPCPAGSGSLSLLYYCFKY